MTKLDFFFISKGMPSLIFTIALMALASQTWDIYIFSLACPRWLTQSVT